MSARDPALFPEQTRLMMQNSDSSTITVEDARLLRGGQVIGVDGDVIGVIGSLLLDPITASPHWVTVDFDDAGYALVPLTGAYRDGQSLRVPFTGAQVSGAPERGHVDALTPDDEQVLRNYYVQVRARGTDQR